MNLLPVFITLANTPGMDNCNLTELAVLYASPNEPPHTVASIAELLHVPKPRVCRVIDNLEWLGLVRRELNKADRRVIFIRSTEKGLRLIAKTLGE